MYAYAHVKKEAHDALLHAADNVPAMPLGAHAAVGALLKLAVRPIGSLGAATAVPSDALTKEVSDLLTTRDSDYAATAQKFFRIARSTNEFKTLLTYGAEGKKLHTYFMSNR